MLTFPHLAPLGRMQTVRAEGTEVAWAEAGAGPALVLLHGVGDWHRTWRRVAPLLAGSFRVLMPDLPGHGLSGRPDAAYTLPWFAGVIAAWMGEIGVPSAHFCGHSYGGGLAQSMMIRHRALVDRLALVASGGLGREVAFPLRLASLPGVEYLSGPLAMRVGTRLSMMLGGAAVGNPEPEEVDALATVNGLPGTGRAFARTVRAVIDTRGQYVRTCRDAAAIESLPPVALFWGDDDPVIPLRHAHMAVDRFRGATLSVFAGAGHVPHLLAPARFALELSDFLTDAGRIAARLLFACPDGPGSGDPLALPIGRCADCTFRR